MPLNTCGFCGHALPENSRFCTHCGRRVDLSPSTEGGGATRPQDRRQSEELNLHVLYGMVAALVLALFFPPWEAPPGHPPEFVGFHFILSPPQIADNGGDTTGVISRFLWMIDLVTIAIAGFYLSWLFRKKDG